MRRNEIAMNFNVLALIKDKNDETFFPSVVETLVTIHQIQINKSSSILARQNARVTNRLQWILLFYYFCFAWIRTNLSSWIETTLSLLALLSRQQTDVVISAVAIYFLVCQHTNTHTCEHECEWDRDRSFCWTAAQIVSVDCNSLLVWLTAAIHFYCSSFLFWFISNVFLSLSCSRSHFSLDFLFLAIAACATDWMTRRDSVATMVMSTRHCALWMSIRNSININVSNGQCKTFNICARCCVATARKNKNKRKKKVCARISGSPKCTKSTVTDNERRTNENHFIRFIIFVFRLSSVDVVGRNSLLPEPHSKSFAGKRNLGRKSQSTRRRHKKATKRNCNKKLFCSL